MATNHRFTGFKGNIRDFKVVTEPIHVSKDVWLAAKVTVTAGVTIAPGCVIGANSVVTKNTEPNGIYVGAPAHKLKERYISMDEDITQSLEKTPKMTPMNTHIRIEIRLCIGCFDSKLEISFNQHHVAFAHREAA